MYKINNLNIYCQEGIDLTDKILVNNGVKTNKILLKDEYSDDAFIPDLELKKIDLSKSNSQFELHNSISLVRLPQDVINLTKNIGISNTESADELQKLKMSRINAYNLFIGKFNNYIKSISINNDKIIPHEIYVGKKQQLTSTINYQRIPALKTGLHIDTWDDLNVTELNAACNRVCFNMGTGHRYFLFVPLTIKEIVEDYLENNNDSKNKISNIENPQKIKEILVQSGGETAPFDQQETIQISTTEIPKLSEVQSKEIDLKDQLHHLKNKNKISTYEIGKLFLTKFSSFPVIFIKLAPFEGYIAPTENLIHDGSNFDSDKTDIQITARGYFKYKYC